MNMQRKRRYASALLVLLLPMASALAETPAEKGLRIAQSADAVNSGWQASRAELTMRLQHRDGDESLRRLKVKSLEQEDDGDKGLMVFEQPRDVRGTALLTHSHQHAADDQWLYLPAIKRVKRIASRNKSGPFVGSEFAFEDLSSPEIEKFSYEYLRDEPCAELVCNVVKRTPKDPYSGYSYQVVWLDQTHQQLRKIAFYDRKKELLKTLTYDDYTLYEDQFWRAATMTMRNHQTGHGTVLEWSNFAFRVEGLDASQFNHSALKRAR